ncbi:MAG: D-Ala-D-Ala carboxypeptidase family metallohydrolase [Candidatus Anstonellaceae archaeon]
MITIANIRNWWANRPQADREFLRPLVERQFRGDIERNAQRLVDAINPVIVPIMQKHKVTVIVTSGFRPVEWERRQGRSGTSQHTQGHAVDFVFAGQNAQAAMQEAWEIISKNWNGGYARKMNGRLFSFIHVDLGRRRTWNY